MNHEPNLSGLEAELDRAGVAVVPELLTPAECADIIALYDRDGVPQHGRDVASRVR